jgi:hypothetical protein
MNGQLRTILDVKFGDMRVKGEQDTRGRGEDDVNAKSCKEIAFQMNRLATFVQRGGIEIRHDCDRWLRWIVSRSGDVSQFRELHFFGDRMSERVPESR